MVVEHLNGTTRRRRNKSRGMAVTIGVYDGVHRGHLWVLQHLKQQAERRGLGKTLVTFDPHPVSVLRPVSAPKLLTDLDQRLTLLARTGTVERCLVIPFNRRCSLQTPESFVEEVLVGLLGVRLVVVGSDFRFGANRAGDTVLLGHLGARFGFEVIGLPLLPSHPAPARVRISSSWIRQMVARGEVQEAARALGRAHEVWGRIAEMPRRAPGSAVEALVVHVPLDRCLPLSGVYAGSVAGVGGEAAAAGIAIRESATELEGQVLDVHLTAIERSQRSMGEPVRLQLHRRVCVQSLTEPSVRLTATNEQWLGLSVFADAVGGAR